MTPDDRGTDAGSASGPPPAGWRDASARYARAVGPRDAPPPPAPSVGWPPPLTEPGPNDFRSPLWARIAIVVGIGCSLVVLYLSTEFAIGQAEGDSPSVAMGYGIAQLPFLVVGIPLLLIGLLRHFKWQLMQRPGLGPVVVLGGIALWTLFTLGGPGLILDVLM
jgi:hypothetical protein